MTGRRRDAAGRVGAHILAGATALMVGVVVAASPAIAQSAGGGVVVVPTSAVGGPTPSYFTWSATPGATISDAVEVTNTSTNAATLDVAPVDGLTAPTSGAVYANNSDPQTRTGTWITPTVTSLTLAPGARQTVGFTVHVPATATAGDHLGGLSFQNTAVATQQSGALAVREVNRSVVGALVQVQGSALPHFTITGARLGPFPGLGVASAVVTIRNDGQLLSKSDLAVTLQTSTYSKTVTRSLDTALPGDTMSPAVPWPDALHPGTYHLSATLTAAGAPSATYSANVTISGSLSNSGRPIVFATPTHSRVPTALLGLAFVGFGVVVGTAGIAFGRRPRST